MLGKPAPPISVVVPLYNKVTTIRRCLHSILAQTWAHFELIVVDDGSTDGSANVARQFTDPRIRIVFQENRGVSAARNRGIEEAAAPLIAFLDADDTWEPPFLDAIAYLARTYPSAGIFATGQRRCVRGAGYVDSCAILPAHACTGLLDDYLGALSEGALIWPSNVAIPRSVLDKVGLFPEGVPIGEDRDLWVRITLRYPIAYDTRILATYHIDAHRLVCPHSCSPTYPEALRTLRRLIDGGTLTLGQVDRARALADWFVLDHLYNLVEVGDATEVRRCLRSETFYHPRFCAEASLLGIAVRCVPLGLITLLKHKHKWLPTYLDRRKVYIGKALIHRRMLTGFDDT